MMDIPYGCQCSDDADIDAVVEALHPEWLPTGQKVAEFEEVFATLADQSCNYERLRAIVCPVAE